MRDHGRSPFYENVCCCIHSIMFFLVHRIYMSAPIMVYCVVFFVQVSSILKSISIPGSTVRIVFSFLFCY